MSPPPPSSNTQLLVEALSHWPRYVADYCVGMIIAVISEPLMTSLLVGSVFLGVLASSVLVALMVFFLVYTVLGTINSIANAIGVGSRSIAQANRMHLPSNNE